MLSNQKSERDERLDGLGRAVLRAASANEREAEEAAQSPFLYARVRTRIRLERERREEGESWFQLLGVVWRAVPAMALVAIFAFALFWSVSLTNPGVASFDPDALVGTQETAGIERVVFADSQPISSDDVLATIYGEDERGGTR